MSEKDEKKDVFIGWATTNEIIKELLNRKNTRFILVVENKGEKSQRGFDFYHSDHYTQFDVMRVLLALNKSFVDYIEVLADQVDDD